MSSFSHPFRNKTGLEFIFSINVIINKIIGKSSTDNRITYNYGEATASKSVFNLAEFSVFPNPTQGILNIDDSSLY